MVSLAASLESAKIPDERIVDWTVSHDRSVLAIEGGTPGALDFRYKMNRILRATHKATRKTAVLRGPLKARVEFSDVAYYTHVNLDEALEDIREELLTLRDLEIEAYKGAGKPLPAHLMPHSGLDNEVEGHNNRFSVVTKFPVGKPSKRMSLADIQLDELFAKRKTELAERTRVLQRAIKIGDEARKDALKSMALRMKQAYDKDHPDGMSLESYAFSPNGVKVSNSIRAPVLHVPLPGLRVEYFSALTINQGDYARLTAFVDRHMYASVWKAPQEAVSDGKVLPLSSPCESFLTKNLKKTKLIAHMSDTEKSWMAWRWLIISYNQSMASAKDKIHLPSHLSIVYERKMEGKVSPSRAGNTEDTKALLSSLREIVDRNSNPQLPPGRLVLEERKVLSFVSDTERMLLSLFSATVSFDEQTKLFYPLDKKGSSPGRDAAAKRVSDTLNEWSKAADSLFNGQETPSFKLEWQGENILKTLIHDLDEKDAASPPPSIDGGVDVSQPETDAILSKDLPECITHGNLDYFREDVGPLLDVHEGQVFQGLQRNGVMYYAIVGEPEGKAKSAKAKGKTPVRDAVSPPPKPSGSKQPASKGKEVEKKKDVPRGVEGDNPLNVKGEPKSANLSEEQRGQLRVYFKLEEGTIPAAEWAGMSRSERTAAMSARSLPRWAVDAVLRNPGNLNRILSGKLTKDNFQESIVKFGSGKSGNKLAQASESWAKLKADFPGVPLLRRPRSSREKAFKKRFDLLVESYGEQPCFPKLRERPDDQGRSKKGNRAQPSAPGPYAGAPPYSGSPAWGWRNPPVYYPPPAYGFGGW